MNQPSHRLPVRAFVLAALATVAAGCALGADDEEPVSPEREDALQVSCVQLPTWTAGVSYHRGDKVQFKGRRYQCIQGHTALSVWPPDIVPALWQDKGQCKSGGSGGTGGSGGAGGTAGTGGSGGSNATGGSGGSNATGGGGGTAGTGGSGAAGAGGSGGSSGAGGTGGTGGAGTTEYAPYFYTWGWGNSAYPFTSLVDLHNKSGLNAVTLAFVLSDGGCAPTQDIQQHQSDVEAFRASGGHLKASFGGALGTYLENGCTSSGALAGAINGFITLTGISDLDFDVEQWGAMTAEVNARRSEALASVQAQTGAKVSFTLAAVPRDKWGTPGGMTSASLEVVRSAVQAGVQISHVNLMVMDYGGYYSDGQEMGALAISALSEAKAQLQGVMAGLSDAQAYAMLGATPMIGQNDVSSEVFTLADAQTLAGFAKQNKLGLVSFWAINRDQPGSGNLGLYSGVNHTTFEFNQIFSAVAQ